MTKPEFLAWLEQFRHIGAVKEFVERHVFSPEELDKLKNDLQNGGRLRVRNAYMRWVT